MESGVLKINDVHNRKLVHKFLRHPEIHLGEAETLAAAKELNGFAIIDEAEARVLAKIYGVRNRTGTPFLLFRLLAIRKIGTKECEKILDDLVESGLYIDSATFMRAKGKIRNFANQE